MVENNRQIDRFPSEMMTNGEMMLHFNLEF